MTLDEFMATTESRLPSASELVELCHALDMRLVMTAATPVVRFKERDRSLAVLIARIIRREPWRTQALRVVQVEPIAAPKEDDRELLWASGHVAGFWFPDRGWPVGARAWRYKGQTEWNRIPGVEWGPLPIPDGVRFSETT